jgi:tRNA threonylcarbamoyladenosine biosynthesis protein TsaB
LNILALDTAGAVLSVALSSPDGTRHVEIDAGSRHSELLMELVDWLLKSAALKPRDLELVACMKGPGSFTGLRIAFATAKGLSLAWDIPLAAVPTLDCMAFPFSAWPGLVLPTIDAKKGRFFAAFYRSGQRLSEYLDAPPEAVLSTLVSLKNSPVEPVILTGSGAELLHSLLPLSSRQGLAVDPCFRKGKAFELLDIVKKTDIINYKEGVYSGPLYLRKSDAEANLDL